MPPTQHVARPLSPSTPCTRRETDTRPNASARFVACRRSTIRRWIAAGRRSSPANAQTPSKPKLVGCPTGRRAKARGLRGTARRCAGSRGRRAPPAVVAVAARTTLDARARRIGALRRLPLVATTSTDESKQPGIGLIVAARPGDGPRSRAWTPPMDDWTQAATYAFASHRPP